MNMQKMNMVSRLLLAVVSLFLGGCAFSQSSKPEKTCHRVVYDSDARLTIDGVRYPDSVGRFPRSDDRLTEFVRGVIGGRSTESRRIHFYVSGACSYMRVVGLIEQLTSCGDVEVLLSVDNRHWIRVSAMASMTLAHQDIPICAFAFDDKLVARTTEENDRCWDVRSDMAELKLHSNDLVQGQQIIVWGHYAMSMSRVAEFIAVVPEDAHVELSFYLMRDPIRPPEK